MDFTALGVEGGGGGEAVFQSVCVRVLVFQDLCPEGRGPKGSCPGWVGSAATQQAPCLDPDVGYLGPGVGEDSPPSPALSQAEGRVQAFQGS